MQVQVDEEQFEFQQQQQPQQEYGVSNKHIKNDILLQFYYGTEKQIHELIAKLRESSETYHSFVASVRNLDSKISKLFTKKLGQQLASILRNWKSRQNFGEQRESESLLKFIEKLVCGQRLLDLESELDAALQQVLSEVVVFEDFSLVLRGLRHIYSVHKELHKNLSRILSPFYREEFSQIPEGALKIHQSPHFEKLSEEQKLILKVDVLCFLNQENSSSEYFIEESEISKYYKVLESKPYDKLLASIVSKRLKVCRQYRELILKTKMQVIEGDVALNWESTKSKVCLCEGLQNAQTLQIVASRSIRLNGTNILAEIIGGNGSYGDCLLVHDGKIYAKWSQELLHQVWEKVNFEERSRSGSSGETFLSLVSCLKRLFENRDKEIRELESHSHPQKKEMAMEYEDKMEEAGKKEEPNEKMEESEKKEGTDSHERTVRYLCRVLKIFTRYISFNSIEVNRRINNLNEIVSPEFVQNLLEFFQENMSRFDTQEGQAKVSVESCKKEGADLKQGESSERWFLESVNAVMTFVAHLFYRRDYQMITPFDHPIGKLVQSLMLGKIAKWPRQWNVLRNYKLIIDRWAETMGSSSESRSKDENLKVYQQLCRRFLTTFLSEEVVVTSKNTSTVFNPIFITKPYCKIYSAEVLSFVAALETDLDRVYLEQTHGQEVEKPKEAMIEEKSEKINTPFEDSPKNFDSIVSKIILFSSGRIEFPDANKISEHLRGIYEKYAHTLPSIYRFRTWIQKTSLKRKSVSIIGSELSELLFKFQKPKQAQDGNFLNKIQGFSVRDLIARNSNHTKTEKQMGFFEDFIEQNAKSINCLQLKTKSNDFGIEVYRKIIAIIDKLSQLLQSLQVRIYENMTSQAEKKLEEQKEISSDSKAEFEDICIQNSLLVMSKDSGYANSDSNSSKPLLRHFMSDRSPIERLQMLMHDWVNALRLYRVNSEVLLSLKDQKDMMEALAEKFTEKLSAQTKIEGSQLKEQPSKGSTDDPIGHYLSDVLISVLGDQRAPFVIESHLQERQALGISRQMHMVQQTKLYPAQEMVPVNEYYSFYATLRPCFKSFLKYFLSIPTSKRQQGTSQQSCLKKAVKLPIQFFREHSRDQNMQPGDCSLYRQWIESQSGFDPKLHSEIQSRLHLQDAQRILRYFLESTINTANGCLENEESKSADEQKSTSNSKAEQMVFGMLEEMLSQILAVDKQEKLEGENKVINSQTKTRLIRFVERYDPDEEGNILSFGSRGVSRSSMRHVLEVVRDKSSSRIVSVKVASNHPQNPFGGNSRYSRGNNIRNLFMRGDREENSGPQMMSNSVRQATEQLRQVNIPEEFIEIALENIEVPDAQLALEWIQNNQERIDDLLIQRVIRESKERELSMGMRAQREPIKPEGSQIQLLTYVEFQERVEKLMKLQVKELAKVLFDSRQQEGSSGPNASELLFILLNSFSREDFRAKQFRNFTVKMFTELDALCKASEQLLDKALGSGNSFEQKFTQIASVLLKTLSQYPKLIEEDFYQNEVFLNMLKVVPKLKSPESIEAYLSLTVLTMPVIKRSSEAKNEGKNHSESENSEASLSMSPILRQYFSCVVEILSVVSENSQNSSSDQTVEKILHKIILTKDEQLTKKVVDFCCASDGRYLLLNSNSYSENNLKTRNNSANATEASNISSIALALLSSDERLFRSNALLEISGFIAENCTDRLKRIQESRSAGSSVKGDSDLQQRASMVIEIDYRKFATAFSKYENYMKAQFEEVFASLFFKRKNKKNSLFIDLQKHKLFDFASEGVEGDLQKNAPKVSCRLVRYAPSDSTARVIETLLSELFSSACGGILEKANKKESEAKASKQKKIIKNLHCMMELYKVLIPSVLSFNGKKDSQGSRQKCLAKWIVSSECLLSDDRVKYDLLMFLAENNHLYVDVSYPGIHPHGTKEGHDTEDEKKGANKSETKAKSQGASQAKETKARLVSVGDWVCWKYQQAIVERLLRGASFWQGAQESRMQVEQQGSMQSAQSQKDRQMYVAIEQQINNLLQLIYLLKLRKFNRMCHLKVLSSKEGKESLLGVLEEMFIRVTRAVKKASSSSPLLPLQVITSQLLNEALYILLKRQMVDRLRGKYEILFEKPEDSIQSQYLCMNLIYKASSSSSASSRGEDKKRIQGGLHGSLQRMRISYNQELEEQEDIHEGEDYEEAGNRFEEGHPMQHVELEDEEMLELIEQSDGLNSRIFIPRRLRRMEGPSSADNEDEFSFLPSEEIPEHAAESDAKEPFSSNGNASQMQEQLLEGAQGGSRKQTENIWALLWMQRLQDIENLLESQFRTEMIPEDQEEVVNQASEKLSNKSESALQKQVASLLEMVDKAKVTLSNEVTDKTNQSVNDPKLSLCSVILPRQLQSDRNIQKFSAQTVSYSFDPKDGVVSLTGSQNSKATLEALPVSLSKSCLLKKCSRFEKRFTALICYFVFAPRFSSEERSRKGIPSKWSVQRLSSAGGDRIEESLIRNHSRIISALRLGRNGESNDDSEAISAINRLMHEAYRGRQQEAGRQNNSRPLNLNRVFGELQELAEEEPKQEEKTQQKQSLEEKSLPKQEKSQVEEKLLPGSQSESKVEEKGQGSALVGETVEGLPVVQDIEEKSQVQGEKMELENIVTQKAEKKVEEAQIQQIGQGQRIIEEEKQEKQEPTQKAESLGAKVEEEKPAEQMMEGEPLHRPENQQQGVEAVSSSVRPHRQILEMFGLPQTFLSDNGIDPESFDQLPEEYQIDQITHYMNQVRVQQQTQQQNTSNSVPQNEEGQNQPQEGSVQPHLQQQTNQNDDNIALFASMDPQTRAQMLADYPPEFLMTLPVSMRTEVESFRQRQIGRILEEQEQMERENHLNPFISKNHRRKNTKMLRFPDVEEINFNNIDEQMARALFETSLLVPSPKMMEGCRLLLENGRTQEKTLATLISLLMRNQEEVKQENLKQNYLVELKFVNNSDQRPANKGKLQEQKQEIIEVKWTAEKVPYQGQLVRKLKSNILGLVYETLKKIPYRCEEFLLNEISTENYLGLGFKELRNHQLSKDTSEYSSIDPLQQLLAVSIDLHMELAVEIVKRMKSKNSKDSSSKSQQQPSAKYNEKLSESLISKIVQCIRKDKLSDKFYENLEFLSKNPLMKAKFEAEFPEDRPLRLETLAKIIQYDFAKVGYLRKMHEEALSLYSAEYNEFLNQIFGIYDMQDVKEIEGLLLKHKHVHFQVIRYLYSQNRVIDKEPMGLILKMPHLLDFETKKYLFRKHPKIRRVARYRLPIEVNRSNILQESYNQLMSKTADELQGRLQVTFVDEPGYDAGGLTREWLMCLSREIFRPGYALFEASSSGNTYQPNPKSYVNPDHLKFFKFIGRFVAKALSENELVDVYFTRAVYKMILGQEIELGDLEQQDYAFYRSMLWLKENPISKEEEGDYTFSYLYDNFGQRVVKDIVQNGRNISVTEGNKHEYIEKYCLAKMRDDFKAQMEMFLEGFHEVIPPECISFFEAKELELLISGLPEIDFEDLRANVDYSGYSPTDPTIQWFWEIVGEFTQEDLARLIQFITGTSKIPVDGFANIKGMNGPQRISIHKDPNPTQLPKAHTCFNQLDIPNYGSKEVLRDRIVTAITWGSEGFGFM